jgi:tetratricopeptide (TPR) repeat protein
MSQELAIDMLTVSRHEEPPADAAVSRALATAGLGVADYTPATRRADSGSKPPPGRTRIGTYMLTGPRPRTAARVIAARYTAPVMAGMAEAAFTALTRGLVAEDTHTLRQGVIGLDLRITTTDQHAVPAMAWGMQVLRVLLDLTQGVAVDPAAQRCYSRAEIGRLQTEDPLAHIAIHAEIWDADSRWLHTHGLQKYGRPELDLVAVPHALETEGDAFLREVAYSLAHGTMLAPGQEIEFEGTGAVVALGTTPDLDHQAPYGRLRLADVPAPGERQGVGARRLLGRMALAEADRLVDEGAPTGAMETIERVLAADPDDCAALMLKAHLYLRAGNVEEALSLGEFMELRVPGDYRGPLTVGMALASMGRYREALLALDRAIEHEPEAAEAFAIRAQVHEQLGNGQLAAVDRAHAAYLTT